MVVYICGKQNRMEFKIEKNIPIQIGYRKKGSVQYPWKDMEVGDSVFIPKPEEKEVKKFSHYLRTNVNYCLLKYKLSWKFKFCTREENKIEGVRVWRVS